MKNLSPAKKYIIGFCSLALIIPNIPQLGSVSSSVYSTVERASSPRMGVYKNYLGMMDLKVNCTDKLVFDPDWNGGGEWRSRNYYGEVGRDVFDHIIDEACY